MKNFFLLIFCSFFLVHAIFAQQNLSFEGEGGTVIIPDSSLPKKAQDSFSKKQIANTNYLRFIPKKPYSSAEPFPLAETPASVACIYGLTPYVSGCPVQGTSMVPTGGQGVIAIVDAFDNPFAEQDLNIFSAQYGLPPCTTANGCFTKVYAAGTPPPVDFDWTGEIVLDIEWAHAMAPNAKIILVEAPSADIKTGLLFGVDVASALVAAEGGGIVSNSWGTPEYEGELADDAHFKTPGVIYFAATGDFSAPPTWPSTSPYVISVGGTTTIRDADRQFVEERGWNRHKVGSLFIGGGGGPSAYEPRPAFQWSVQKITGNARGAPDFSAIANPHPGVSVYDTFFGGWVVDGGTSASTPIMAGIYNSAGIRAVSSSAALEQTYERALKHYHDYWNDIIIGNNGHKALTGYDFVTGLGSPRTYAGK